MLLLATPVFALHDQSRIYEAPLKALLKSMAGYAPCLWTEWVITKVLRIPKAVHTVLDPAETTTYSTFMTVTAEYAQSHLQELLVATEHGEQVEITRPDGYAVRLQVSAGTSASPRR